MVEHPLYEWSARDLASAIARKRISAVEVMRAFLGRIEQWNPKVNSIVSLQPASAALGQAEAADRRVASGEPIGPLHGLPTAVKDMNAVRGFRTTYGSRSHQDDPPAETDAPISAVVREAGALIIGKTNTPEYGVGTLAFNDVFGVTRNPWDLSRHGGGSSGAAAALAARMLPLADGGDSGGSIRYPSSFCNTVGLRPTPGRVFSTLASDAWGPHIVIGPMARSSADAALMLAAIGQTSVFDPLGAEDDPRHLIDPPHFDLSRVRLAWSTDAGGLPVAPDVRNAYGRSRLALQALGCQVDDVDLDFSTADRAWEVVEMFGFFADAPLLIHERPDLFRPDYVRNVRQGAATAAADLAFGLRERTKLFRAAAALLRDYDAFVTPATPVAAPPAEVEWVEEIAGVRFGRYFEWQRMACRLTMTAHPVLVTPGHLTEAGLPCGLQLVGRHRGERDLLALGSAIEAATGWAAQRPSLD